MRTLHVEIYTTIVMEFKAQQIADLVGGTIEGNPDALISTFAKIEEASAGAISFLANPKYEHHIYETGASAVLVRRDFKPQQEVAATLIRVDNPYATLAKLLEFAAAAMTPQRVGIEQPCFIAEGVEIPEGCYVGAFAYVAKGAKIGKNVKIYPQAYVGDGVVIGDDTIIYPGAKIYHGCKIGCRCIIHSGVVIGSDGFGHAPMPDGSYSKIQQIGIVEIQDDVEIGSNTTIDRATMGATVIEHGVKLDNLIQAAHNVRIGANTVVAAQAGFAGSSTIGQSCMIGGQVGIAGHISVGDRVQIGAQSGIPNNVGSDLRIMGYPAVRDIDFARQTVHIKRLGDLFSRVSKIEKSLKSDK